MSPCLCICRRKTKPYFFRRKLAWIFRLLWVAGALTTAVQCSLSLSLSLSVGGETSLHTVMFAQQLARGPSCLCSVESVPREAIGLVLHRSEDKEAATIFAPIRKIESRRANLQQNRNTRTHNSPKKGHDERRTKTNTTAREINTTQVRFHRSTRTRRPRGLYKRKTHTRISCVCR